MDRKCYKCQETKDIKEFPSKGRSAIGIQLFKYVCKSCDSERLREFRRINSNYKPKVKISTESIYDWWWRYKESLNCSDCSLSFQNQGYLCDFHHINPSTKLFNLGGGYKRFSREKILMEVSKCVPLCSNCHKKRHHLQKINLRSEEGTR